MTDDNKTFAYLGFDVSSTGAAYWVARTDMAAVAATRGEG